MRIRTLVIHGSLALTLAAGPAEARMYRWVNPDSGRTQLSGQPPAWYRSGAGGPRIRVFENGKLIDDTATERSRAEREALRKEAFERASQDKQASAEREAERRSPAQHAQSAGTGSPAPAEPPPGDHAPPPLGLFDGTAAAIERLKKIIAEWESRRDTKRPFEGEEAPSTAPPGPLPPLY